MARARDLRGEDIRLLLDEALWSRFGERTLTAPVEIQWLSDNGSPYTSTDTVLYAQTLGFRPVTTPAYSPESNGMSEAFVNTIKRDYVGGADPPGRKKYRVGIEKKELKQNPPPLQGQKFIKWDRGGLEPGLRLQTESGVYAPVLQPPRIRRGHPTVICFLIKQRRVDPAFESLSERELGVLRLLVKGLTNQLIADALRISIETVRTHVSHALEKTGTKTRAGLVGRALGR